MEITTKQHRWNTIGNWKRNGLIYPDYDELYQTYINTLECQHCLKEFKSTRDRCLDHCHITGEFRKIVCQKCNCWDSYIKYPDGYSKNQKHNCECGGKYSNNYKAKHLKSNKHQSFVENN